MRIFRTWVFKWWEIGLVKLCLLSLGILLGIYFADFLSGAMWLWWVLFLGTTAYFLPKVFKDEKSIA